VVDIADALQMGGDAREAAAGSQGAGPVVTLDEGERMLVRRALEATNGRIHGPDGAAALLGLNGNTLRSRMQKLGITKHVS
jgi:transcriptional regulator with GAF, ATPase, and Fis domain